MAFLLSCLLWFPCNAASPSSSPILFPYKQYEEWSGYLSDASRFCTILSIQPGFLIPAIAHILSPPRKAVAGTNSCKFVRFPTNPPSQPNLCLYKFYVRWLEYHQVDPRSSPILSIQNSFSILDCAHNLALLEMGERLISVRQYARFQANLPHLPILFLYKPLLGRAVCHWGIPRFSPILSIHDSFSIQDCAHNRALLEMGGRLISGRQYTRSLANLPHLPILFLYKPLLGHAVCHWDTPRFSPTPSIQQCCSNPGCGRMRVLSEKVERSFSGRRSGRFPASLQTLSTLLFHKLFLVQWEYSSGESEHLDHDRHSIQFFNPRLWTNLPRFFERKKVSISSAK